MGSKAAGIDIKYVKNFLSFCIHFDNWPNINYWTS